MTKEKINQHNLHPHIILKILAIEYLGNKNEDNIIDNIAIKKPKYTAFKNLFYKTIRFSI